MNFLKKLPVFLHKKKTKAYFKILRHGSLQTNVINMLVKFQFSYSRIPHFTVCLPIFKHYYILIAYAFGYLMIQNRLQCKRE